MKKLLLIGAMAMLATAPQGAAEDEVIAADPLAAGSILGDFGL